MGWEYFTKPLEAGEKVTPEMQQELAAAYEERMKAVFDLGSSVVEFPSGNFRSLLMRADIRTYEGMPNEVTATLPRLISFGSTAIASSFRQPYDLGSYSNGITASNSLLRVAAKDLGYTDSDVDSSGIINPSTPPPSYSQFYYNVCRRAIQLMDTVALPLRASFSTPESRQANYYELFSETKSASNVSGYSSAKSDFLSSDWIDQGSSTLLDCLITTTRNTFCNYSITAHRRRGEMALSTEPFGNGYKLYAEIDATSPGASSVFGVITPFFSFGSEDGPNIPITAEQGFQETLLMDMSEEGDPVLSGSILFQAKESVDSGFLDVHPVPTRESCGDSDTIQYNSRAGRLSSGPYRLYLKPNFEYGPDS